jgi:pimeloyl-ACP methyl ester carboxylesterase
MRAVIVAAEETAGVSVMIDCCGYGKPALVFVHGGGCDRHDWNAQVEALAPRFRTVAFDLPGHGDSGPSVAQNIETLAHTVCTVCSRYGGDHAVLIGHGMGCRIVLQAFQQSPAGIAGLVLVDGSRLAESAADRAVIEGRVRAIGIDEFIGAAFRSMFVSGSDSALRRHVIARAERWDRAFAEELLLSAARWDAGDSTRVLAGINVPVLIVQSTRIEDGRVQSLELGMTSPWIDLVTQQVRGTELRLAPGVGHFTQIEAAGAVNKYIEDFARRLLSSQGAHSQAPTTPAPPLPEMTQRRIGAAGEADYIY